MTHAPEDRSSRGWRNHSLVRETDEHRVRLRVRTVLMIVLAALPMGFYLIEEAECMKISYEVSDLLVTHEELVKQELELKVEKAKLESLSEIEDWALLERGLAVPRPEEVVVVRTAPIEQVDLLASAPGVARAHSRN